MRFSLGGRAVSRSLLAPGFIQRHTPVIDVQAPETLAEVPLLKQPPAGNFFLWIPGAEWRLKKQWMQQYPAVGDVQFEKHYLNNRITARLEPRIPLVRLEDRGLDKDGTLFTLASQSWTPVPKATLPATRSLPALGHWLSELSHNTAFWSQVVAVSQDLRGEMWLEMQTGTRVAWGPPESKTRARQSARAWRWFWTTRISDWAERRQQMYVFLKRAA